MSQQTAVEIYMGKAFAGLIADCRPREVDSKIWEGADGNFGVFVTRGTGDGQVILPSGAGDQMIGPIVAHQSIELERGVTNIVIEAEDGVNVMRTGNMYVRTEDACSPGDSVFVRHTVSGGNTQLGSSRTDADTATAVEVDWEFEETGAIGDIVKIRKK